MKLRRAVPAAIVTAVALASFATAAASTPFPAQHFRSHLWAVSRSTRGLSRSSTPKARGCTRVTSTS